MKSFGLIYFCLGALWLSSSSCAENNQDEHDPKVEAVSPRIMKLFNKLDNELCDVWQVLSEYNNKVESQKRENARLQIQIAELSKRVGVLDGHTHGYFLSSAHGGLGPKTQTTKPLQVKTETPLPKPLQVKTDQTTEPVVKPQ